jgi:hypothetical protein
MTLSGYVVFGCFFWLPVSVFGYGFSASRSSCGPDDNVEEKQMSVPEQFRHEPTEATGHCKHCGELCAELILERNICSVRFGVSKRLQQVVATDQTIARLADVLPTMWFSLYSKSCEAGFTEDQAMKLVLMYVKTSCRSSQ